MKKMTKIKITETMVQEFKKITLDDLIRFGKPDTLGQGLLLYLAAPYTHEDAFVEEMRYNFVNKIAALLIEKGICTFSPLSHGVPIAKAGNLDGSWETFKHIDNKMIYAADALVILPFPGWQQSLGVSCEAAKALKWGMWIYVLDLKDLARCYPEIGSQLRIAGYL